MGLLPISHIPAPDPLASPRTQPTIILLCHLAFPGGNAVLCLRGPTFGNGYKLPVTGQPLSWAGGTPALPELQNIT